MPNRSLSPCKRPGCPNLVRGRGYCPEHQNDQKVITRDRFKRLDERKTNDQKRFYSSEAWTNASRRHRDIEPLCRRCKTEGQIVPADLVHHNPSLQDLLNRGLNPLDDRYLESLCLRCHQKELKGKSCG